MTKSRHINASKTHWTQELVALLVEKYPHISTSKLAPMLDKTEQQIYHKAHLLGLKKTQEYMAGPDGGRLLRGTEIGKSYQFSKGHIPVNKGVKGISYPGTEATQFKKGEKPHTWRPIGSERLSKEGYLQVKLKDTGVSRHDYVPVHHLVWELHRGAIPKGHRIAFKDGDKTHITFENLEAVSIAEMMRRNTLHNYPKEIAQLMRLRGLVNRKINRRLKDERPTDTTSE
ncbi:MAG: HNH endonuclease [Gallionella sp.]|nr:HNH endonuclease [Gallionella sp.]